MIQVFDNYLDRNSHSSLEASLTAFNFPWYFLPSKIGDTNLGLYDYQFSHTFYIDNMFVSDNAPVLGPLIQKINPYSLVKVKANLTVADTVVREYSYHNDVDKYPQVKTAIYYINTNDGYTKFETGEVVKSVANRLVVFDSNIKHTGTTHTNTKYRCVVNLNYF